MIRPSSSPRSEAPALVEGRRAILLRVAPFLLLGALCAGLYLPFLDNPLVFDDLGLYRNQRLSDLAVSPFNGSLRQFPNFTLAAIDVIFEERGLMANRFFALLAHLTAACLVVVLVRRLCEQCEPCEPCEQSQAAPGTPASKLREHASFYATITGAVFAAHPVAVYGAGYLIQRSIVFATIFAILTILLFEQSVRERRIKLLLAAAFMYAMAVFSKEHAIMVAVATAVVVPLWRQRFRQDLKWVVSYLILCAPVALYVIGLRKNELGSATEPEVAGVMSMIGIPELATMTGQWLVSATIQTALFFKYLAVWWFPNPAWLAVDFRIDFASRWATPEAAFGVTSFFLLPIAAILGIRSRHAALGLAGFGILLSWMLFFPELASARFQEPWVLYRSYLWAPGILLTLTALGSTLPTRFVALLAVVAVSAGVWLSLDRLHTFSSPLALWEDAASKLEREDLPGSPRIFFNTGVELLRGGHLERAGHQFRRIVAVSPQDFRGPYGLAITALRSNRLDEALESMDLAIKMRSNVGEIHMFRGVILEALGRKADARSAYVLAVDLGELGGKFRLEKLERPIAIKLNSPPQ